MASLAFNELTEQVRLLNDIILEDLVCEKTKHEQELARFNRHLFIVKNWFTRISASNKKGFLLALLQDIKSAWTLSNVLKCIWNSRTKDAVMSVCERTPLSYYDRMPMDHNRAAQPMSTLTQVMMSDRTWILSLEPELQSTAICELLSVVGGPVLWEILNRCQVIYERYRMNQIKNIEMSIMVTDSSHEKPTTVSFAQFPPDKNINTGSKASLSQQQQLSSKPQRVPVLPVSEELNKYLAQWNAAIKSMKDRLGLEELEVIFKDGTERNIWKIKRANPENTETVDFIQLLPSTISKQILSYLSRAKLDDYARVNKYWAYLINDYQAELAARAKLNANLEKLEELMSLHDTSMRELHVFDSTDFKVIAPSIQAASIAPSIKIRAQQLQQEVDTKTSMKSATAYSFKHFLRNKMDKPDNTAIQVPIRRVTELTERLDCRGALDDNMWAWCRSILKQRTRCQRAASPPEDAKEPEGVLLLRNQHFPCPLMSQSLDLPLSPPLLKDHTVWSQVRPKRNISNATVISMARERDVKRVGLWTRNLSSMYHAYKVPSYSDIVK